MVASFHGNRPTSQSNWHGCANPRTAEVTGSGARLRKGCLLGFVYYIYIVQIIRSDGPGLKARARRSQVAICLYVVHSKGRSNVNHL